MNVMPSHVQSGRSRVGARGARPPLFLDLFRTFKMKESGRKIEPKEIPKLFDSSLLPYWYLFSQVFNFAFLVILKKSPFH